QILNGELAGLEDQVTERVGEEVERRGHAGHERHLCRRPILAPALIASTPGRMSTRASENMSRVVILQSRHRPAASTRMPRMTRATPSPTSSRWLPTPGGSSGGLI